MKIHDHYPSDRPPEPIRTILALILARHFHYDVVGVRVNALAPKVSEKALREHCNKVNIEHGGKSFQRDWKAGVVLLQPRPEAIALLREMLREFRVPPAYAEFALDLIVRTEGDARLLLRLLVECLTAKSWQQEVTIYRGTVYFASRCLFNVEKALEDGKPPHRRGVNLVLYVRQAKKGSPHEGEWCVHMEWRISGTPEFHGLGVFDLDGLVRFDHAGLWMERAKVWAPPSLARLGAWAEPDDFEVSRNTLIGRGHALLEEYEDGGFFILQNAVIDQGKRRKAFERMFDASWTRAVLRGFAG